jgi:hypothetical protein
METRAKISSARRGIKLSVETRAKLSAATTALHGVAVVVTNIETGVTEEFSTLFFFCFAEKNRSRLSSECK